MRTREQHLAALLERALRQRQRLEGEVRALGAELQALRSGLRETELELEGPTAAPTAASAVALTNRQRYQALLQARRARLVEDAGQAERRLGERRVTLERAAQQAQVWEKLAARLEHKRAQQDQRLQQEIIDQHSQARHRDRSI